jgi:hypothetical protein
MDFSLRKLLVVLLVLHCNFTFATPTLHKSTFEFNSKLSVQEEFIIFSAETVTDPVYSLNELRIQFISGTTYEDLEFRDRVVTTFGQAVAYNTLDSRWIEFKGKLLYHTPEIDGTNKQDIVKFRVVNPAGEFSDWGEIKINLDSSSVLGPKLHQKIFEFNSRLRVQEEFSILSAESVSDPVYSMNDLRIQLNSGKTYDQLGFYDKVYTTFGQTVAYNTLDRRWIEFKGKLLYHTPQSDGNDKMEKIPFRVINPAGEVSEWAEVRISLDGRFDQNYDYYPVEDTVVTKEEENVVINVLANDPSVQWFYNVETYQSPSNGSLNISADKQNFTYTPNVGFIGTDSFQYWVIGNNLYEVDSAPTTVTITVTASNQKPVITGTPINEVTIGQNYLFSPIASDVNSSDILTFSITGKPSWITFNSQTGQLQGIPQANDIGIDSDITISVSDGLTSVALAPFDIEVLPNLSDLFVNIVEPLHNSQLSVGGVNVIATTSESLNVQTLEFSVDGITWLADVDGVTPWLYNFPLLAVGQHTIAVRALVNTGAYSAIDTVTIDIAFDVPEITIDYTSLTASYILQWGTVAGTSSFQLEERIDQGQWKIIETTSLTRKSFESQNPALYSYRIKACDATGECSAVSSEKTVTVGMKLEQCLVP